MIGRARENWRRFKESKPGHRFQDHYRHQQKGSSGRSNLQVILSIVGGFLVVGGGIIVVPGPAPGWLIILLELGMIAGVSLSFASFIGRVEVKLRGLARWVVGPWVAWPALAKVLMLVTILICAVTLGYGIYYLIFAG